MADFNVVFVQLNPDSHRLSITYDVAPPGGASPAANDIECLLDTGGPILELVFDSWVLDGDGSRTTLIAQLVPGSAALAGTNEAYIAAGSGGTASGGFGPAAFSAIDSNTPNCDTVIDQDMEASGYWRCNDSSGTTLVAAKGSDGTIVGSPTLNAVGGLFNEPFGGYGITLATGKYLRMPATSWLAALSSGGAGVWVSCHFKTSVDTQNILFGAFRTAGFADGIVIETGYNRAQASPAVSSTRISVAIYDSSARHAAHAFNFSEARYRDGKWHSLLVFIKVTGTQTLTVKLYLDGLLLTATDTYAHGSANFTTVGDLNLGDLVSGGYSAGAGYTALNNGFSVQRIAIGTGEPTAAEATAVAQTLYFVDDYGLRRTAFWKPDAGYAFTEPDFTGPSGDSTIARINIDHTGNGYHLVPNADAELQSDPEWAYPVRFESDESGDGQPYLRIHNIHASTLYSAPELRFCAMDLKPGIGGTCVAALLNFDAVCGMTQVSPGGQTEQRMFTFGAGVSEGSVGFQNGRPKQATSTENPVATPSPIIRCAPTISYCQWAGGADGVILVNSVGKFFLDGTTTAGTDSLAGNYTTARAIGGSTVWTYGGGEPTGKFGFSGRIYRMGLCDAPWTDTERAAAWAAHKTLMGIPDKPEWVLFNGGDSISSFNYSANQIGYAQLLEPGGAIYDGTQWRDGALYINAVHGLRCDDTNNTGQTALDEVDYLIDAGYAYGLDNTTRFTALWFLGVNDGLLTPETAAVSLAALSDAVDEFTAIVPVGAFEQHVALTVPSWGVVDGTFRTAFNAGLPAIMDRVVTTPEGADLYDPPHPDDTGFAEIAAAINDDSDNPMGWVVADQVESVARRSLIPVLIASGLLN